MSFLTKWRTKWDSFVLFAKEVNNWKQVTLYLIKITGYVLVTWMILHYSAGSAYKIILDGLLGWYHENQSLSMDLVCIDSRHIYHHSPSQWLERTYHPWMDQSRLDPHNSLDWDYNYSISFDSKCVSHHIFILVNN